MMKLLFFLVLLSVASPSFSQENEPLYTGRWKTNNPSNYTVIGYRNNEIRKYLLASSAPKEEQMIYQILVDGIPLAAPFYAKSWVIVEGKDITIRQTKPGKSYSGTWKVIQEPEILSEKMIWSSDVSQTNDVLLMSLKTEQDFVVEFGFKDVNMNLGCENVTFTLFVDGVALKDENNKDLPIVLGSSIVGRGKIIVVRSKGVCTNPTVTVFGSLKLKKLMQ
ncbi:hypothetical protein [Pedobacter gandavensis]|uniref:hypothetical protein n=1 Tax=Pedobacter gandavensis TaxID=2679963 RepID=UPI00292E4255|nr:hypothetical protein [Pedobacter gandavensis]